MPENAYFYKLDSPTTKIAFAAMLANQDTQEDSTNIFRTHNLIGRVANGGNWQYPIGHIYDVDMEDGGVFRSYLDIPLVSDFDAMDPNYVPGTTGAQGGKNRDAYIARPHFDLKISEIRGPLVGFPGKFHESLVPARIFRQHYMQLRSWWDSVFSNIMHKYAAGSVGYGKHLQAVRAQSTVLDGNPDANASNEPLNFQMLNRANPMRRPSRLFASWEDYPGEDGNNPSMGDASNTDYHPWEMAA